MIETKNNLEWLAFRYVANELEADEVSEFESQLLVNQAAREAVAAAVAETLQIRQAFAGDVVTTAASQRSSWGQNSTRIAIVALGSSLSLLLAVCLVQTSHPVASDRPAAGRPIDASAQLAFAWAEARQGMSESSPVITNSLADSLDATSLAFTDSDLERSLVPPSWMLAAVGGMESGIDSEFEVQE